MTDRPPRIWLLLGERAGDNNQLIALAEELGLPFETRPLHHNFLRNVARKQLSRTMLTFTAKSLRQLRPPWPDLVIGIGRRSVPVACWIKKRSGGTAKLVQIWSSPPRNIQFQAGLMCWSFRWR
jgi:mitochondrial fission protein ELM1